MSTYTAGGYGFVYQGDSVERAACDRQNKELEQTEIAWLQTHPEHCVLYVKRTVATPLPQCRETAVITTWLGTHIAPCYMSPRHNIGFGYRTYRRHVTCTIFGKLYAGWYMESSGDYVRLKRCK